jgi:hypothetical protein
MASVVITTPKGATVHILNPVPGGFHDTSALRAERFVRSKRARWDACGNLVFQGPSKSNPGALPVVSLRFDGVDARPGMPVLPPSPEWLARMYPDRHQPVRPPLRKLCGV